MNTQEMTGDLVRCEFCSKLVGTDDRMLEHIKYNHPTQEQIDSTIAKIKHVQKELEDAAQAGDRILLVMKAIDLGDLSLLLAAQSSAML